MESYQINFNANWIFRGNVVWSVIWPNVAGLVKLRAGGPKLAWLKALNISMRKSK